jgi:UDP-glucose:(heptosyl)LPS alpha-1,3-glucosyltransferase
VNIALLIERFGATGGAERMAGAVVEGLRARGHEPHVYAARFDGDVRGLCVPHSVSARGLNRHVAFARNAKKALDRHDVVVSFTRTLDHDLLRLGGGIHAEYLRRMEAARSALGRVFSRINPKERAILRLERDGLAAARIVVAVSRRVRDEAVAHYAVPRDRVEVLHNGVDLDRFAPGTKESRAAWLRAAGIPDGFTVLFAGSGFRRKGLRTAIDAVALVPEARLVVCGKDAPGPWRGHAERRGAGSRVHFLGQRADIAAAYAAADALVLPSLYDPFPNVCLEALACGTPIVVSAVCGPSEILREGADGFIADGPDAIAGALRRIRAGGDAMRAAARACAERHPIQAWVDAMAAFCERARRP